MSFGYNCSNLVRVGRPVIRRDVIADFGDRPLRVRPTHAEGWTRTDCTALRRRSAADGGETSLDHLVQLCRFHHCPLHEVGFGCGRKADGRIVLTNPFGDEIPESAEAAIPADRDAIDWLQADVDPLHIDSDTGACRWQGEAIDWALAVGHLFDQWAASG